MTTLPVLQPQSATSWRHRLLALAALAGAVSAGIVLGSQEVTDFLREGPVRVTSLEGDRLQIVLGLGTLLGTGSLSEQSGLVSSRCGSRLPRWLWSVASF